MSDNPDLAAVLRHVRSAPPLPPPEGKIVRVEDGEGLVRAVESAEAGTCILLPDGTYKVPRDFLLTASDVELRGESGDRDAVVIDGADGDLTGSDPATPMPPAILRIKRAERVRIADVTFRNSIKYAIMAYGDSGVHGLRVYNVKFHNIWVRGLKGTHPMRPDDRELGEGNHPPDVVEKVRPHNGEVRHCLFLCDHVKTDLEDGFGGDYISGIDMMGLADWTFADNAFVGIRGANGGGRGAIFIWHGADRVTAERNLFINCDRGIAFGNPSGKDVSVAGGAIRDNTFIGGANKSIECCTTRQADISGNRLFGTSDVHYTVQFAHGNDGARFHGNWVHGSVSCDDGVRMENNHIGRYKNCFIDPATGDLNLTAEGKEQFGIR